MKERNEQQDVQKPGQSGSKTNDEGPVSNASEERTKLSEETGEHGNQKNDLAGSDSAIPLSGNETIGNP